MSSRLLVIYCGLLIATNALSTDILLPALFAMSQDLAAPIETVQLVTPAFMFLAGFGQLAMGPLSDRVGRKPIVLTGISLYIAGAVLATLSGSAMVVVLGRCLQGFGSAAAIAAGRAILRDTHSGTDLARAMAMATSLIAIGPITAPILGITLLSLGGWRLNFIAMGLFGCAMLAVALLRLPETNTEKNPDATRPSVLRAALKRIFTHPQSRFFLIMSSATAFLIISFLTHAPRLVKTAFGIEGLGFVALFALMGIAIPIGQLANRHVLPRLGPMVTTRLASGVLFAVSVLLLVLEASDLLSVWAFSALMFTFNTCYLVVMANAASLSMDPHREIAGLVAALYGFLTQLVPAAVAMATIPLIRGEVLPWAKAMTLVSAVVLVAVMLYRPGASAPKH